MKIHLICVGKLKEKYLVQGCNEYQKRLTPYAKCSIIEVAEEMGKDPVSKAEREQILKKEADRILSRLHANTYTIALAIEGTQFSSTQLAHKIDRLMLAGHSHFTFIIGSTYGLATEVLTQADLLLSFSPMTFPHQLMRLLLLEQIYRVIKINRGETYHK